MWRDIGYGRAPSSSARGGKRLPRACMRLYASRQISRQCSLTRARSAPPPRASLRCCSCGFLQEVPAAGRLCLARPAVSAPRAAAQSACAHERDSVATPNVFTRCVPRSTPPFCRFKHTRRPPCPADPPARLEAASTARSRIPTPPAFNLARLGPKSCHGRSSAFSALARPSGPR